MGSLANLRDLTFVRCAPMTDEVFRELIARLPSLCRLQLQDTQLPSPAAVEAMQKSGKALLEFCSADAACASFEITSDPSAIY